MKLLTKWQNWWARGRNEQKFHCDLLLGPGEYVEIYTKRATDSVYSHSQVIGDMDMFTKVHLSASWEFRSTEFVEEE